MIRYEWHDLFWLIGFLAGNLYFYTTSATAGQFFVYNFALLLTMFVVGILKYRIRKLEGAKKK